MRFLIIIKRLWKGGVDQRKSRIYLDCSTGLSTDFEVKAGLNRKGVKVEMPKKVISVILTVCLLAVAFSPSLVFAGQTTDYNQHWAADSIEYLLDENIIQGYGNDPSYITVRPNNPISRAEFAVVINKAFNYTKAEGSNFPDVPEGAWYANDLKIAKTAGYFKGDSNGLANPTANITRSEVCAVLYQVLGLTKADMVGNTFNDQIPEWALEPVLALVGKGLVNGYPNGSFKANSSITRAESFVIVHKALNMKEEAPKQPELPQTPVVSETPEQPTTPTNQSETEPALILKETSITVQINSTKQITVQDYPAEDLTYASANQEIATVNDQGLVRGQKEGTTTIAVSTPDGTKKATCTVKVEAKTSSGGGGGGGGSSSKPSTTLDITSQTAGIVDVSTYHLQGAVKASKGIAEVSYKLNDGQSVVLFTSENSGKKTSYTIDVPDIELAEGNNTIIVTAVDSKNNSIDKSITLKYVTSSDNPGGKCGDNLFWSFDPDTGVLEITGSGAMYEYGYGAVPWAGYCQYIAVINLPDSLTSIGAWAFYQCSSLTTLDLPDSLTSIEYAAFQRCSSLTTLDLPDSLTSIGGSAFFGCSSLTELDLPDSLTSIGELTFYDCTSLAIINWPERLTSIEEGAFSGCGSLRTLDLPDSLISIEKSAFFGCGSLTTINWPDSLTSIGYAAFQGCSSLTELDLPDSLTSIGERAFEYCSSLTTLDLPDSLTSIGELTFYDCTSLAIINWPERLTSIGGWAFYHCIPLTIITLPESLTSIGYGAFQRCSSLREAYFRGDAPTSFGLSVFDDTVEDFTIYFLDDKSGWTTPEWNGYHTEYAPDIELAEGNNTIVVKAVDASNNAGFAEQPDQDCE